MASVAKEVAEKKSENKTSKKNNQVRDFLLKLALCADRTRFYPFPAFARKTPLDADDEKKADPFQAYGSKDYENLSHQLKQLKTSLTNGTELTAKQMLLLYYIESPCKNIAFHDTSLCPQITEFQFRQDYFQERLITIQHPKRWYVFHGSNLGNWHSIMHNGIRTMSGTKFQKNGAAYGAGVYASTDISIGISYGSSGKNLACVAVLEMFEDPEKYRVQPNHPYMVIPDDVKFIPRYLLKVKLPFKYEAGRGILDKYEKWTNDRLKGLNAHKGRIDHDFKQITEIENMFILEYNNETFKGNMMICECVIQFNLHSFPFEAPLFRIEHKTDPPLPKEHFTESGYYKIPFENWCPTISLKDIITDLKKIIQPLSAV